MKEITVYETLDGTRFNTEEDCKAYEQSVKENFKALVIKEMESSQMSIDTEFALSEGGDDCFYALIGIKDTDDLKVCQTYYKNTEDGYRWGTFTKDMIGKQIVVFVGDGIYPKPTKGKVCKYNSCMIYGTIEEQIANYEKVLRQLEEVDADDQNS